MSDFFNDRVEPTENTEQQVIEEKIKLGEQEFTQGELSRLVGLGRLAEEAETKYNTRIDKVWPDYSKTKNYVKELETKLSEAESKVKAQPEVPENEQIRQAKQAARSIGIVTDENFNEMLESKFQQQYAAQRAVEKLIEQGESLEGKYNGTDGRPKFQKEEIFEYMKETGIRNPELAYKARYEDQLDQWKEQQLKAARRPGFTTQTSTGGMKMPAPVKIDKNNLDRLVRESLHISEDME